jgi:hypothetical protein
MTRKEREDLQAYFDEKFRGVDQRFDGMDQRFAAVDQRFDGMDQQIAGMSQRFAKIDAHLDCQDAALEKTTMNLLLTIEAEGAKSRRYADRLFANVDAPMGSALESPQPRDRPKRRASARGPAK